MTEPGYEPAVDPTYRLDASIRWLRHAASEQSADTAKLYYECHITIEPCLDDRLEQVSTIVRSHGFRVADLLMQKRRVDTPVRSRYDTFCTTRSKSYRDIEQRMLACVAELSAAGFAVWRYKIEDTLLDVTLKDGER